MRQLLMTVLLLLTVVGLYTNLANGEGGTKEQLLSSGTRMASKIAKMSP